MDGCSYLPEVIIIHILSRLPVKSVGQCRCVCKLWRVLLSEPQFIRTHLNNTKNIQHEESLILVSRSLDGSVTSVQFSRVHHLFDEDTVSPESLTFLDHHHVFSCSRIHGSCDGLVLVARDNRTNFLINPLTQELRRIPEFRFALGYDSLSDNCKIFYGLGYDSLSDDYKIVTLSYINGNKCPTKTFVNIYSLRSNTWKKVESFLFDDQFDVHSSLSVLVDGNIHWLGTRCALARDTRPLIVAFNFAQEKFFEVPLPSLPAEEANFYDIQVLGGCLCTYSKFRSDIVQMDVWVMKEYGVENSWTKAFTIFDSGLLMRTTPLCLLDGGEVVLVKHTQIVDRKLVIYDVEEGTTTDIVSLFGDIQICRRTFTESLVSPHHYRNKIGS